MQPNRTSMQPNRTAVRWRVSAEYDIYMLAAQMHDLLRKSFTLHYTFEALDAQGVAIWTEDGDPRESPAIVTPRQSEASLSS